MTTRSSSSASTSLLLSLLLLLVPACAAETANTPAETVESAQSSTRPAPPAPPGPPAAAAAATGRVGSHGMVLVGSPSAAFLSHIPMFGAPHDVQLVVAGSFASLDAGGTLPASLPTSFSDASFTFLPDRMSLDALRTGALTELRGTIFMGNFEQAGRPLPSRVRFVVSRVVHQHILDASQAQPAPELTYFLFGSQETTFAAHRIGGSPSFDEVLRVNLQGANAPSDAALAAGVEARIAGSSDVLAKRAGATSFTLKTAEVGGATFTLKTAKELSCLEGPDFTAACE